MTAITATTVISKELEQMTWVAGNCSNETYSAIKN